LRMISCGSMGLSGVGLYVRVWTPKADHLQLQSPDSRKSIAATIVSLRAIPASCGVASPLNCIVGIMSRGFPCERGCPGK
jgi:hypothetical protein